MLLVLLCISALPLRAQQTEEASNQPIPQSAPTSNSALERYQVGEELLFTFQLDNLRYGELLGIVTQEGVVVSFTEFITMLDFPIQKQDGVYNYSGWFISEVNNFTLSLSINATSSDAGQVSIRDRIEIISSKDVLDFAGERFISIDTMANWFGIGVELDYRDLVIQGTPSTKLPVQLKFERENKRVFDSYNRIIKHPNYDFGYHWRSHQLFDANVFSQYNNDELSTSYSVIGIQDIAKLSTRFYFSGSDEEPLQQGTLSFQRQSTEGGILGPLNATNLNFGDILPTRTGGSSASQSVGVSINNNQLGVNYDIDITSIRGLVQDGWDVELYQNGVLIRQSQNIDNGRYDCVDVPLFTGLNKFEIVKYGPQGQIIKEQIERNVDGTLFSQVPSYNLSLTRTNSTLLGISDLGDAPQDWSLAGTYGYAFNNWLSASIGHSIFIGDTDRVNSYSISGVARISSRLIASAIAGFDEDGAGSIQASLQSRYFDQNLNLNLSSSKSAVGEVSSQLSVLMNGNLFSQSWGSVSYTNDYRYGTNDSDESSTFFSNGLTFDNRYFTANHLYTYQKQQNETEVLSENRSGLVSLGSRIKRISARVNANYDANDDFKWVSYGAGLSWRFASKYSTRIAFQKSVISDNETVSVGIDWREKAYAVNTQLMHDSVSGMNISLNARFSMSETPVGPGYLSTDSSLTSSGIVLVRLYEDKNFNFIFDEGDRPLEDVKVTASQFNVIARSDKEGIVKLNRLTSFQNTDLDVDLSTLDDPYLIQSTISTAVTPRTGLLALVNYPFVQSAELEGSATFTDKYGRDQALAFSRVVLKNQDDKVIAETKSEFDGYFYINQIPPGKYTVTVDDETLSSKELVLNQKVMVHLDEPGSFISGIALSATIKKSTTGFLSYIAAFSSPTSANTYKRMFDNRNTYNILSKKTFVTYDKGSETYYLAVGFFNADDKANDFCLKNMTQLRNCEVKAHKIFN